MKAEILREDEREMEVAMDSLTIASMLARYLSDDPRVEFAAFKQEHPLVEKVTLFLRVKEGKPRDVLKENIQRALSDVKALGEALLSSLS
ncbi:MAG: hypothetical protein GXO00_02905 [Candidatus Diapherotrites archaeon]|nr:hypothetical protein [Candidatus Diapherotrites archaeon]